MLYLLVTVIIQNGMTDIFFDEKPSLKACLKDRKESLKRDNELTKVRAYCIKPEFKLDK